MDLMKYTQRYSGIWDKQSPALLNCSCINVLLCKYHVHICICKGMYLMSCNEWKQHGMDFYLCWALAKSLQQDENRHHMFWEGTSVNLTLHSQISQNIQARPNMYIYIYYQLFLLFHTFSMYLFTYLFMCIYIYIYETLFLRQTFMLQVLECFFFTPQVVGL